ncbi:MAG: anthrone oxygenase family protein, partial [Pyrinomonadaceae bacterium]
MPARVRKFAIVAGALVVVVVVWTFFFFIPILQQTQATGGAGLSGEEITRLTNQFLTWNYLRQVLLIGSWISGLKAFS